MDLRERRSERPSQTSAGQGQIGQTTAEVRAPSTEFYREIVEGMTCGVLTVNRDGLITTLNDHARVILELYEEDVIGRHCEEALGHCPRLAQVLLESFSMSSPPSRAELEIREPDERGRIIGFSISMITSFPERRVEGAALFFKDLTKVEEQEERERLRDRLAALGEMAAQMAHEIRNPLTSIEVSLTLLKRRLATKGERTDLLEKVGAEVARIEATIANCLQYARPLAPRMVPIEPAALLDEAISLARLRKGSDGVDVERTYAAGLVPVLCDRTLINDSLVNILVNAYEAMEGRGTITVSAECVAARAKERATGVVAPSADGARDDSERILVVRIADTGPGIPPQLRDRIFYPFFTTKPQGSGIGLASARKAVESHGGWLDVESEPGQGTTFIMKLPLGGRTSGANA
jgi:PAS domain S-box-containing protein